VSRRYQLLVPPLAFAELDDRLVHAVADALAAEADLRLPRFLRHLRQLMPTVIKQEPDPWDWAPCDERWGADAWARHGATVGARAAWAGIAIPSGAPPTRDLARARCWLAAALHAYTTTSQTLTSEGHHQ
jgi:hypothetical protein